MTEEQLKQYQEEDVAFLGKVLTDEQLEGLRAEESSFCAARGMDEGKSGKQGFGNVAAYSLVLRKVISQGAHVGALPQL